MSPPSPSVVQTQTAAAIARRKERRSVTVSRTVDIRTVDGGTDGTVELDPALFGITPNLGVLHQVVTAQMAAARSGTHSTKRRSEVRGGGAKPWRQKGTGRARQGSIRAAQWVGGGIAMGPKPRSYVQRTPRKMVRLALASVLSDRAASERVIVIRDWEFDEPRTKDAVAALDALGVSGKLLVILDEDDGVAYKSFANLPGVGLMPARHMTAWDVIRADWVIFTVDTLPGAGADDEEADDEGDED